MPQLTKQQKREKQARMLLNLVCGRVDANDVATAIQWREESSAIVPAWVSIIAAAPPSKLPKAQIIAKIELAHDLMDESIIL